MRLFFWGLLTVLLTGSAGAQLNFVPATTLSAETSNNTAAPATINTTTAGNAASGNVSKLPLRSLLYPGSQTRIYAALMGWFGKSSHISVGYNSKDSVQMERQVTDMMSRGIDGAILAWYGQGPNFENDAALLLQRTAEQHAPFEFAIMIDKGAITWDSKGLAPTDALISHLNYIARTYYPSPAYMRIAGRPVVFEFALEFYTIDWTRVRNSIAGNPIIIFRNPNGFTRPLSDGAYAWEPDQASLAYLDYFYQQAGKYPVQTTVGGVSQGFNDSLASWSQHRIADPQCGQTWLSKFAAQSKYFSSARPLPVLQVATWNDYEEGTTIESGIDNCIVMNAGSDRTAVTWQLGGAGLENTIDHYTVFLSRDGENLMPVADLPASARRLELGDLGLVGSYSVFVKAVGKPSLLNQMSNPVSMQFASGLLRPRRPNRFGNGSSSSAMRLESAGEPLGLIDLVRAVRLRR